MTGIDLSGVTALVTGSSRGIGWEIARQMGLAGASVTLCARDGKNLDLAVERLRALDIRCHPIGADLRAADAPRRVVEAAAAHWGALDVLVNNVGGLPSTGRLEDLDDDQWLACFEINAMSTVRFCRAALPYLKKSRQPRIINITSAVAEQPGLFNPHYSAAKAFVWNLSRHLANALACDGILVNCIAPGIVDTDSWNTYIVEKAAAESIPIEVCRATESGRAAASVPLARLGQAQEVAFLATVLASAQSSFVTGSNLRVDGGKVRGI